MERGTVRICDFGWAVYHTSSLRTTFCGTPLYVSPEILKGESYDEKVDLWAVGIMAWEMMYGDIPFEINCEQELIKIVTWL
jgi:serine/threonine protein kinase